MSHPQTQLSEDYGKQKKDYPIEQKPLKKIPNPPESVIEYLCNINGLSDQEKIFVKDKFFKKYPQFEREVQDYFNNLQKINAYNYENSKFPNFEFTGDGIIPIEKIEMIESDHKKHGYIQWMLIIGFEFFRKDERTFMVKQYIPLKW